MQKFFLKSQLSYNCQTSKTTICKNGLQNRTKYLNCSQSKRMTTPRFEPVTFQPATLYLNLSAMEAIGQMLFFPQTLFTVGPFNLMVPSVKKVRHVLDFSLQASSLQSDFLVTQPRRLLVNISQKRITFPRFEPATFQLVALQLDLGATEAICQPTCYSLTVFRVGFLNLMSWSVKKL